MILLSINYEPYALDFCTFNFEKKTLLRYGTSFYKSKNTTDRIIEIRNDINELFELTKPTLVITQMLDLRYTLKRDLEHVVTIRTLLRLACYDRNIMFNEFSTYGWEKRLTNTKSSSKKAKLRIVREYSKKIDREQIANTIIMAEGVSHNRLQIGVD